MFLTAHLSNLFGKCVSTTVYVHVFLLKKKKKSFFFLVHFGNFSLILAFPFIIFDAIAQNLHKKYGCKPYW